MKEAANRGGLNAARGLKRADYAANAHIARTLTAMRAAASPTACHFGLCGQTVGKPVLRKQGAIAG